MTRNITRTFIAFAAVAALGLATASTHAATISKSVSAPAVDGADIANLGGTLIRDFGTQFMWPDRPARGQSFTTGANTNGYLLDAVTIQAYQDGLETSTYNLRIGSLSGTAFTPLSTETGFSFGTDIDEDDFVTFQLDTPVLLAPNTVYGFDMGIIGSDGGFGSHGWGPVGNDQSSYADGSAYNSNGGNPNQPFGGPTVNFISGQDRIFHINLEDVVAVPEPATALLALLGFGGTMMRRRRVG